MTPWSTACQASLSLTISWFLAKFMSIESMMPSKHLILCCPLLLLPSSFLSIRVFSNESDVHITWAKYWSFSFSISPSNGLSGVFSSTTVLQCSAFFMVQLSHPYMTEKNIYNFDNTDLCWQSDVSAFNMLSKFVIAFLPRSKQLLISWLQSPSAVILEPKKIKSVTISIYSPSICHEMMRSDDIIFVF